MEGEEAGMISSEKKGEYEINPPGASIHSTIPIDF